MTRNEQGLLALAVVLGAAILGYVFLAPSDAPVARPTFTGDAAVVEHFQCYRCHSAPDHLVPATREQSCVTCHQSILAGGFDDTVAPADVARWQSHIENLLLVPSLDGLSERVTAEWLRAFLEAPHDLRPNLPASMPRLRTTADEREAIVRHFGVREASDDERAPEGDPARGRARYEALGCSACHLYSGATDLGPTALDPTVSDAARSIAALSNAALSDAARLAPDLRNARARMTRAMALRWITSPGSIQRETRMPTVDASDEDRADLVAFLFDEPLTAPAPSAPIARLPLLARPVGHAEVDEAVFHRTCRHCHADPVPVGGDGGPGNTGGFGFAGRGFDLSTYEGFDASREALLAPDDDGVPLLIAALVRRHDEVRGVLDEGRGMPLALPPISLRDLQLVESWVAQGAPR